MLFGDLAICGFLVWSDYVPTAAAVVIMCPFTAEPHVLLYGSTINNVLFTAVGRQLREFEPSLRCFSVSPPLFSVLFLGGWFKGFLSNCGAVYSSSNRTPDEWVRPHSFPSFCFFFCFVFRFLFWWVRGVNCC